jgi:hypothetical protein
MVARREVERAIESEEQVPCEPHALLAAVIGDVAAMDDEVGLQFVDILDGQSADVRGFGHEVPVPPKERSGVRIRAQVAIAQDDESHLAAPLPYILRLPRQS